MLGRLAQERFLLYLLVCSVLGGIIGFFGVLAIYVILAWNHIGAFLFDVFSMGVT